MEEDACDVYLLKRHHILKFVYLTSAMLLLFTFELLLLHKHYQGHEKRVEVYNLYHILNHDVLFGGMYVNQARGMIDRILSS